MSASGKSSNRLREYRRGRNYGTGHGIYAAAGKRDKARAEEVRCPGCGSADCAWKRVECEKQVPSKEPE